MQGFFLGFIIFALVLGLAAVGVYLATDGQIVYTAQNFVLRLQLASRGAELDAPFSSDASPLRFHIAPGAGAGAIAAALFDQALISDAELFINYARVEGFDRRFEAGVYFLNQTQTIRQIAAILTDSSKSFISFRIPEGSRIEELAVLVDQNALFDFTGAAFLLLVDETAELPTAFAAWAGIPEGASLEGFMFPDTYQLPPDITAVALRDTLLRAFRDRVGDSLRAAALEQDLTLYQIATLASIIEREAVWRDEHALIASVYRNRLDIGMALEADPTVQYGIQGARGTWWPQITRADYRDVIHPITPTSIAVCRPGRSLARDYPPFKRLYIPKNPSTSIFARPATARITTTSPSHLTSICKTAAEFMRPVDKVISRLHVCHRPRHETAANAWDRLRAVVRPHPPTNPGPPAIGRRRWHARSSRDRRLQTGSPTLARTSIPTA